MSRQLSEDTRLVIRRTLPAPREKVFRALTEPARLARWMAPTDDFRVTAEVDLKVGGRYAMEMVSSAGEEHRVSGEYLEIAPPDRLVMSWAWISTPDRVSRVTFELSDAGGGRTSLTLTHDRLFDRAARDHHETGWNGCLDRLHRSIAANP